MKNLTAAAAINNLNGLDLNSFSFMLSRKELSFEDNGGNTYVFGIESYLSLYNGFEAKLRYFESSNGRAFFSDFDVESVSVGGYEYESYAICDLANNVAYKLGLMIDAYNDFDLDIDLESMLEADNEAEAKDAESYSVEVILYNEAIERFNDHLNDIFGYTVIAGSSYCTGYALKAADETAYNLALNDFIDMLESEGVQIKGY